MNRTAGNGPHRSGAPGGTRTPDPLLRRQTLYPAELRAPQHIISVATAFSRCSLEAQILKAFVNHPRFVRFKSVQERIDAGLSRLLASGPVWNLNVGSTTR